MKLSNDLTLIESKNKEDVKLYNSFTNTLTELNSEIYDYLNEDSVIISIAAGYTMNKLEEIYPNSK